MGLLSYYNKNVCPGIEAATDPTERSYSLLLHLPFVLWFSFVLAIINNTSLNTATHTREFKSHSISSSPFGTLSPELLVEIDTFPIFRDNRKQKLKILVLL